MLLERLPTYNPDLLPRDYDVFSSSRKGLKEQRFADRKAVQAAFENWFHSHPRSSFIQGKPSSLEPAEAPVSKQLYVRYHFLFCKLTLKGLSNSILYLFYNKWSRSY